MLEFNLPYRYAQRSQGETRDYVFYSAIDPSEGRLRRKRIYLDHIRDSRTRDKYARKLIEQVNNLLDNGRNPFIDQGNKKKMMRCITEPAYRRYSIA